MAQTIDKNWTVFAVHECTPETNGEENCCGCDFPFEMLSYVECQAGCFDWWCCLLPDRPSAPSLPQRKTRMVIQRAGWSVTSEDHHWLFDSVVSLFITVRHSLHNKGLLVSILSACVPCRQTHACTRSTCWDSLWKAMHGESLQRSQLPTFGSTPTFGQVWTFLLWLKAADYLMTHSWPTHLYIGASLRML